MERFGIDKPDLRYGWEIRDLTPHLGADAAPFLAEARAAGGRLRGIVAPGGAALTRKDIDSLTAAAKEARRRRADLGPAHRRGLGGAGGEGRRPVVARRLGGCRG